MLTERAGVEYALGKYPGHKARVEEEEEGGKEEDEDGCAEIGVSSLLAMRLVPLKKSSGDDTHGEKGTVTAANRTSQNHCRSTRAIHRDRRRRQ